MQVKISDKTSELLKRCEKLYRDHHPELDEIYLSKNKLMYEIAMFYLRGTDY